MLPNKQGPDLRSWKTLSTLSLTLDLVYRNWLDSQQTPLKVFLYVGATEISISWK